ncbi:MmcQ/YjbR family DNA-binding protein [Dokdonella sp.]|uniref:MmcQ/YjbR family DNA-binding protein n=1 Tax=Dokdonella sp. TaxID=2291710 RepID=UPI001B0DED8C|nr:MmcQ/YjbR family DNA-binding protein [Dokdonella sp.]MBO9663009.1 MmcQ/YjbR family DNA-binding protein [Dokdonella sp.]
MAPDSFRRLALRLPEASEGSHLGTTDFRVRGKIFATLGGGGVNGRAVVKLTAAQQEMFLHLDAQAFAPVSGAWGGKGWTWLHLRDAKEALVRDALLAAWRNVAPKRLAAQMDRGSGNE